MSTVLRMVRDCIAYRKPHYTIPSRGSDAFGMEAYPKIRAAINRGIQKKNSNKKTKSKNIMIENLFHLKENNKSGDQSPLKKRGESEKP